MIVQDDHFDLTASVTICPTTTSEVEAPLFRRVEPSPSNGLTRTSRLMVDKVTTVPRANLGQRLGRLSDADMVRLDRSLVVFLGLAG